MPPATPCRERRFARRLRPATRAVRQATRRPFRSRSPDLDLQVLRAQLAQSVVVRRPWLPRRTQRAARVYAERSSLSIGYMRGSRRSFDRRHEPRQRLPVPYRRPTRSRRYWCLSAWRATPTPIAWSHILTWTADAIPLRHPGRPRRVIPFGIRCLRRPPDRDVVCRDRIRRHLDGTKGLAAPAHLAALSPGADTSHARHFEPVSPPRSRGAERRAAGDGKLEQILSSADISRCRTIDAFGYALLEAMAEAFPSLAVCRCSAGDRA